MSRELDAGILALFGHAAAPRPGHAASRCLCPPCARSEYIPTAVDRLTDAELAAVYERPSMGDCRLPWHMRRY